MRITTMFIAGLAWAAAAAACWAQCDPEETQKILASDGAEQDFFAGSVSVVGDVAIIGAAGDDDNGEGSGAAYVYRFDGAAWIEEAKLTASDGAAGDTFGRSVSVDGALAIVGAEEDSHGGMSLAGSAYIFRFDGVGWNEEAKLTASDGADGDRLGGSVSIDGQVVVIGAAGDDDDGGNSGSAYIYRFDGASWAQEAKLTASDGAGGDTFGVSVSARGGVALVGARGDDDSGNNTGAAYVYRFNGTSWNEEAKLTASDGAAGAYFGGSVATDGSVVLVGAQGAGGFVGAAYVYRFDGASWAEEAKLSASDGAAGDGFSNAVSVEGEALLVGAAGDDDNGDSSGAAYVYRFDGASWNEEAKLTASDGAAGDDFGHSVSINGGRTLIGAVEDDGVGPGSAYVFDVACACPGDFNGDGVADTRDFVAYLNAWADERDEDCSGGGCAADFNGDGVVDTRDFIEFLGVWAAGC